MIAVWVSVAVAAVSLTALLASRLWRGWLRLIIQRAGMYTAVPSVTAALVLIPMQIDVAFSDALAVGGLFLSVVFGLGSSRIDRLNMRLRVGVVIPSRAPFHTGLRSGLKDAFTGARIDLYDDCLARGAKENLTEFIPSLRRVCDWQPDYLIICSPSPALLSSDSCMDLLRSHCGKGGGIVFIDNEPTGSAAADLAPFGSVTADIESVGTVLADYLSSVAAGGEEILVLCGPRSSDPAERYRGALEAKLPDASIVVGDSKGWSAGAAEVSLSRELDAGKRPSFVLCGNDVMAFGAIQALRRHPRRSELLDVRVIGYNGIPRALFAIAEGGNPFSATVSIPPTAYGQEAGAMIVADATRWGRHSRLRACVIPIADSQLVDRTNVELILEE